MNIRAVARYAVSLSFFGVVLSAVLLALVNVVANAQEPPSLVINTLLSGPVQIISNSEFDQLVQSGQAKVISPAILEEQNQQRILTEHKNRAVFDEFMRQNPNLQDFAALVEATPTSPDVFPTRDGNYETVLTFDDGAFPQTIETMGQDTVLSEVADSIQAWSDPAQQLALYQSLYSRYTALYSQVCTAPSSSLSAVNTSPGGCANLTPPSALTDPSVLQNASLEAIHNAIQSIGSQGPNLLTIVPLTPLGIPSLEPLCSSVEIGASSAPGVNLPIGPWDFGDQTNSSLCTAATPASDGILRNFTWLGKEWLTCVKNQGGRGSCQHFAATSAVETLIARDTGNHVNLSEQDFLENDNLLWDPAHLQSRDPAHDLQHAAENGYNFAYEKQWDYNPTKNCDHYPSSIEPGCSNSFSQAPAVCTYRKGKEVCGLVAVHFSSSSPYSVSAGDVHNIWNPTPSVMLVSIALELASGNAVMLAFKETNNFHHPHHGYIEYDPSCDLNPNWKTAGCKTGGFLGGHVVQIVAFGNNSDLASDSNTSSALPGAGGGYFVIKNSWGECYGDAGYAYMPFAYLRHTATGVWAVSGVNH